MCEKCYVLKALFEAADSNPHFNYLPSIAFINKMIDQDRIGRRQI